MTYEIKPGISKNIAHVIHCRSCAQPMQSVYSVDARDTCKPCGGEALMDSALALKMRRIERGKRQKIERENKRLLQ